MVASHTETPLGVSKWLVKRHHTNTTLLLCKGQGQTMSPTQGQAKLLGGNPIPAISHPLKGELYGWLPLSDASGIILSILDIPNVLLLYNVCFTFENLSNNIRILTPNKGHLHERNGHSVEKTPYFEVFCKMLTDKWLHEFKTVNVRFTKSKFAKGIV